MIKSLKVTDMIYHGNGATVTFNDNSVVEMVHSSKWDINKRQKEALDDYNDKNCGTKTEDLRFILGASETSPSHGNDSVSVLRINSDKGIIYFNNPTELQIETYKYTRHTGGEHSSGKTVFSDRLGKRYKPYNMLPMGVTEWVVPDGLRREQKRQYLRFSTWDPINKTRAQLGPDIVIVSSNRDMNKGTGKILLSDFM